MHKMGFIFFSADQYLFIKREVIITVWVNNILACGLNKKDLNDIAILVGKTFKTTDLDILTRFLGMQIVRDWHKREIYLF
jgi:hypothetical protein